MGRPKSWGSFFFYLLDKSVATKFLCCAHVLILCVPQPCRVRLGCCPVAHAFMSCAPGSVMGDKVSLSCVAGHLCCARQGASVTRFVRQSCAPSLICRAYLAWSVMRAWPSHTQLCCDLKILCRDRNSSYSGQLYRDITCSVAT